MGSGRSGRKWSQQRAQNVQRLRGGKKHGLLKDQKGGFPAGAYVKGKHNGRSRQERKIGGGDKGLIWKGVEFESQRHGKASQGRASKAEGWISGTPLISFLCFIGVTDIFSNLSVSQSFIFFKGTS